MVKTKIANFPVEYLQVMDEHGTIDESLMPQVSDAMILKMLKTMLYSRKFDEKMLSLQRQGRIGTIPQGKGQEACSLGAVACLNLDDIIFPSYREWSALIWRNVPLKYVFMNFSGDERGNSADFNYRVFPFNIPIATHMPHAVGVALGMKLKKKNRVVVCFLGDGTTSEGDFHESMNFAGVFKVPCVFICQNNQYAISTPTKKQTASETFAQKGIAYGMPCIRVDGNDVFAMYVAVQEAIARARRGEGPTFIEAFTYRLCDHTTSDDAKRYRSEEEFKAWEKKDPLLRLKAFVAKKGLWTVSGEEAFLADVEEKINKQVEEFETIEPPDFEDMFKYMFAEMTAPQKEQLHYIKQFRGKYHGHS